MSLRLKILFPVILLSLAVIALLGLAARDAWLTNSLAQAKSRTDAQVSALLTATGAFAVERGTGNGILANATAATPAAFARLAEARRAGEGALEAALATLRAEPAVPQALLAPHLAALRETGSALAPARAALESLARQPDARGTLPAPSAWFTQATAQIDAIDALRLTLEAAFLESRDQVARSTALRAALAEIAEQSGRERGLMNGIIAAGRPPSPAEQRALGGFAARVDEAWARLALLRQDQPAPLLAALAEAERLRDTQVAPLRQAVLQAADTAGAYPVPAAAWFATTTRGIEQILLAQRAVGEALAEAVARQDADSTAQMWIDGAVIGLVLGLLAMMLLWIGRAVTTPIKHAVEAISAIAWGQIETPIQPRRTLDSRAADDIDRLLVAAEGLRLAAIAAREAEEAVAAERLAATEERTAVLRAMADRVDTEVRAGVDAVMERMTALRDRAEAVSASAESIAGDGSAVAAAAEESLASAGSVAAATEELTASIGEISKQISETAKAARGANTLCAEGGASIRGLAEAVQRIGGAAALIADVAARTNLLALNATIEAARAGEAGKGFAVVASEVKQLAAQTARATEDINRQIAEVGTATDGAINAVNAIAGAVGKVDEATGAIAAAVEQQAVTTREIAGIVAQTADASREVTRSIQLVARESATTSKRVDEVRTETAQAENAVAELKSTLAAVIRTAAPETNRRKHERLQLDPMPKAELIGGPQGPVATQIFDLSIGGIGLATEVKVAEGNTMQLRAPALGLSQTVRLRILECAEGRLRCSFEALSDEAAAQLDAFIAAQTRLAA